MTYKFEYECSYFENFIISSPNIDFYTKEFRPRIEKLHSDQPQPGPFLIFSMAW